MLFFVVVIVDDDSGGVAIGGGGCGAVSDQGSAGPRADLSAGPPKNPQLPPNSPLNPPTLQSVKFIEDSAFG